MTQINDWLSIDKTSGEGDATITLTTNSSTSIREKVYGLKIKGVSKSVVLNVKQEAIIKQVSVTTLNTFPYDGGEQELIINSNIPWVIETEGDWFYLDKYNGGIGETTIKVSAVFNTMSLERSGEIKFLCDGIEIAKVATKQTYNPNGTDEDVSTKYLWFKLEEDGVIGTNKRDSVQYSYDTINWSDFIFSSAANVSTANVQGQRKVYIRNTKRYWGDVGYEYIINTKTRCSIGGNLSSMGDIQALGFKGIFSGNSNLIDASQLILPWNVLYNSCYWNMFAYCTSLVNPPQLTATELAPNCYSEMFKGCKSLVTAPELPATTLAQNCYSGMFYNCTSLVNAPELPATTLTLACYSGMFEGCTSLVTAPELPATDLYMGCYQYMFQGCTSLTDAPIFNISTMGENALIYMFCDCSSLSYVKFLYDGKVNALYAERWLYNVSPTGTFVKHPNGKFNNGVNGIPEGWTVETATS